MKKRKFNRLTLKGMTLLLIVWILGAAACATPASLPVKEESIIPEKDAYSVFIYLCGSDLETKRGAATKNIQELLDADLGDDVNIVLQTGGTKSGAALAYPPQVFNAMRLKMARFCCWKACPTIVWENQLLWRIFFATE